jgi:hypothetical protein
LDFLRQWQSFRTVARLYEEQQAAALETIEQVLASLAVVPERDHALDALMAAIESDRDRLAASMREGVERRC